MTDQYGYPAFVCAADQAALEPLAGEPSVLACAKCGHRTDTPGSGVLGDGFDLMHRQWGLRGDPHIWWAIRDQVGATPTPPTRDDVRAAFVDAVRRVADVDIDHTDEPIVYRKHLDHGGMSGGAVDVGWWRTKGIPLLVDRAWERRPTKGPSAAPTPGPAREPARRPGGLGDRVIGMLVWLLLLAIPAGLVGGGLFLLYQRAWGTRVDATVLSCDTSSGVFSGASTASTECIAQAIRSSDVVLVVIGRAWADEPDGRLGVVTMQDPDGAEILLEVADEIDIPFVAA